MANEAQVEYWNSKVGETWTRFQDALDRSFTPLTGALLGLAAPAPGEHVLDVGCGTGEISLACDAAIGEEGTVLGLDISRDMLARARERAEELQSETEFREADAATFAEDDGFDLIVSRFGVMFFDDPIAAFANLRARLAPGGRMVFACWQPADHNLWATLPLTVLADLLPPQPAADPHAPGPFAFADPDRLGGILQAAGWQDVAIHGFEFGMVTGDGDDPVASALRFALRIGPAARAVAEAGVDEQARALLAPALAAYLKDGQVALPAACWLIEGRG